MIELDSDDSDLFVECQYKPVNSLTVKDSLHIKEKVLRQAKLSLFSLKKSSVKVNSNTVTIDVLDDSPTLKKARYSQKKGDGSGRKSSFGKKRKSIGGNATSPGKSNVNISVEKTVELTSNLTSIEKDSNLNCLNSVNVIDLEEERSGCNSNSSWQTPVLIESPKTKITDYFASTPPKSPGISLTSPTKKKTTVSPLIEKTESGENIILSPSIRKNVKRFKSVTDGKSSPSKSPKNNSNNSKSTSNTPRRRLFDVPPFPTRDTSSSLSTNQQEENTGFDAEILGMMIRDVMEKQQVLKKISNHINNQEFCPLLSDFDIDVMQKYLMLAINSQTLYMRMFFRRNGWHRTSTIKYADFTCSLESIVNDLKTEGFFDTDMESCHLKTQLNLLKMSELRELCKKFSVIVAVQRKEEFIKSLLANSKQQVSVSDMFKCNKTSSREEKMRRFTNQLLGSCFKLSSRFHKVLSRVVLLFSLVHDVDDESKRATDQKFMLFQVISGTLRFIPYIVTPSVIFQSREDFLEYEKAIDLKRDFEDALQSKEFETFSKLSELSYHNLKALLNDAEYCSRVEQLPSFLKKYCAGSVYTSILTQFCENFKKKTDNCVIIEILSSLLDQNFFGFGFRGKWFELLSQAYESSFMMEDAARTILRGSSDESLSDVWNCVLQLRAQKLIKIKNQRRIKDEELREALDAYSTLSVQEPANIVINAKAVAGNIQGSKIVYVQETSSGKRYSSVEEQAIYYYKENGFTEGIHAEGFIVSTIFFLLFFDTVYLPKIAGVFQSSYQERPLDLYSSAFYHNRKEAFDAQLEEMKLWSMKDVAARIESVFAEYMGTTCVVTWKEYLSPRLLCEIIECLGIPALIKICERFIFNPRQARSGFPDLTLWNSTTKICKFVEVKSPNDRLSPKQRVWMDYLKKSGIDCEVCNVKNVAAKKIR